MSTLEDLVSLAGRFPSLSRSVPSCLYLAMTLTSHYNLDLLHKVMAQTCDAEMKGDNPAVLASDRLVN